MLLYAIDFPLRAMRNFSVKFILLCIFVWPFVQPQGNCGFIHITLITLNNFYEQHSYSNGNFTIA